MKKVYALPRSATVLLLLLGLCNGAPSPSEDKTVSLVISSTSAAPTPEFTSAADKEDTKSPTLKIYQLKVDTNVTNRYAKSLITSKVRNLKENAQEAVFSVVIPDQAFISGFTMEIDGKSYEAYVKEKEEAKNIYDTAVASGQSAGHVAVSARDSNRFTVSVNVEPQSKATFYLKYEELLQRKNEKYEVVLNIHPGQPVKDMEVTVNIYESSPLKFVKIPSLRSGNEISKNDTNVLPEASIKNINATAASVTFNPDVEKQKELAKGLGVENNDEGLSGQFVVQYDVERDPQGSEVLVDGGYFVHFFSPEDLPALPKQVVFVLDTSGSMEGIRLTQLKQAMNSILGELKSEDVFSIVDFNSVVRVWNIGSTKVQYEEGEDPYSYYPHPTTTEATKKEPKALPPSYKATSENIENAKKVIKQFGAFGGTDIQSALKVGLEIVKRNKDPKSHQPIVIFLTDGEPTVGTIDTKKITSTVTELDSKKTPIFSLSFGDGADREFLEKLSLKNQGFSRHIYEAADAYLQLEDFYRQISSPLLTNVTFKYVETSTKNVTQKEFPILFRGGELVTTGLIDPGFAPPSVEGWGVRGPMLFEPIVHQAAGSLERLWAFQTIKQILRHRDLSDDKERYTEEALKLALKYSFVTDVSSLVVVKPNASSAVDTEDGSKSVPDYRYPISPSALGAPISYSAQSYSSVSRVASGSAGYAPLAFNTRPGVLYSPVYSAMPMPAMLPESYIESDVQNQIYSTTTIPPLSTTDEADDERVENSTELRIPAEISWLNDVINENGEIKLKTGTYKLGLNETISEKPQCQNAPENNTGYCVLIQNCPDIYPKLTNLDAFSKYFCDIQSYAGVCCPISN